MAARKKLSPSKLRENIYNVLDEVIRSGVPVEIVRGGVVLTLMPPPSSDRLGRLKKPKKSCIVGDPEDLVHIDWSETWSGWK